MIRTIGLVLLAGAAAAQRLPERTSAALPHAGLGTSPGPQPRTPANAHPGAMRYGDPARTGRSAFPGAELGQLDWRFRIAGAAPSLAVARDGTIHCGTVFHEE